MKPQDSLQNGRIFSLSHRMEEGGGEAALRRSPPNRKSQIANLKSKPLPPQSQIANRKPKIQTAGFTLLEVVLAITIATGLLTVAVHFYHQAAGLRTQLLEESERLAAVRLLMDRISTDLRTVLPQSPDSLNGDGIGLRFVKADVLSRSAWTPASPDRKQTLETDLKLVTYGVTRATEGTNLVITGITRTERSYTGMETPSANLTLTNALASSTTTNQVAQTITDALRFVRFRYWDGSVWVDSWTDSALPEGIEVSLGTEPLPEGEYTDDYANELFRRVIYLPASHASARGRSTTTAQNP